MKVAKIILMSVFAVVSIVILGVISLSAYQRFQERRLESEIDDIVKASKELKSDVKEKKRELSKCQIKLSIGSQEVAWECPRFVSFYDNLKASESKSELEFGTDGQVDTLLLKSKNSSKFCSFPLPLKKGARELSGVLIDRCEIKIGDAVASPFLDESSEFVIKDGIHYTDRDSLIMQINDAPLSWYKLREKSPLLDKKLTMRIHIVFDGQKLLD